ncbi:MAG: hypothetical protein P8X57_15505 [Cyclobacteriaceae bacterium]
MRYYFTFLLTLFPVFIYAQSAGEQLDSLVSQITTYEETLSASMGGGPFHLLTDLDYQASGERYQGFLNKLKSITENSLTPQAVTYQLLHHKLQNEVDEIRFQRYLVPMNAEGGFYNSFPYSNRSPGLNSHGDLEDYMSYLGHYAEWLESRMQLLRLGI